MYYIKQPLQKILLFKYMWIWHKQLAKTDNFDSKVKRKKKTPPSSLAGDERRTPRTSAASWHDFQDQVSPVAC